MSNRARKRAGGGVVRVAWQHGGVAAGGLPRVRDGESWQWAEMIYLSILSCLPSHPSHFLHHLHRLLRLILNKDSPAFHARISRNANRQSLSLISFYPLKQWIAAGLCGFLRLNELTRFLFSCLKAAEITTLQTHKNHDHENQICSRNNG
jgi:hypothetical protein